MARILFVPFIMFPIIAALIVLKGFALYHAARRSDTLWFIALLVLQTMGILELIYLFFVVKGHSCCGGSHHHGGGDCCAERDN